MAAEGLDIYRLGAGKSARLVVTCKLILPMYLRSARVALFLIVASFMAQGQQNDTTFRLDVNEVIVPVTVTDEQGRFVANLEKKDFQILKRTSRKRSARLPKTKISQW